jgi:type VI secretion system secreted protein Hcp
MDIFLKIDGIEGESKDETHKGDIQVLAWSWGASNRTQYDNETEDKIKFEYLSLTKYIDTASSALLKGLCEGTHYDNATLVSREKNGVEYVVITMEDVMITALSTGGSEGEYRLTENISLGFTRFTYKYQQQDQEGAAFGDPKEYKF